MPQSQRLRIHEMRLVADLVGQVGELGTDPTAWRTHALHGLIRLLHGQVGMTVDIEGAQVGVIPRLIDPIDVGWIDSAVRQKYYSYFQSEVMDDPGANALFENHQKVCFLTATREQLIDDKTWYGSRAVSELRRFGQVDDFASSSVALSPGCLQGFIVYRHWGDAPFALRQRRLLRLFHLWMLRLYKEGLQHENPQIRGLPPRVRQTLELLLAGESMKQIAEKLAISPHTVNDYMKTLYRRLGVSTRTQLLKQALQPRLHPRLVLPQGVQRPNPVSS